MLPPVGVIMMREILIRIKCDSCHIDLDEDTVVEVKAQTPQSSYEADLCLDCANGWTQYLRPVKSRAKRGTSGPHACDLCDKRFSKPAGLARHKTVTHAGGSA